MNTLLKFPTQTKMPPVKEAYDETRRLHMTKAEVSALARAASTIGRHGQRDALMITMAYRHGLRASELVELKWSQVDFNTRELRVVRKKGSIDSTQILHEKHELPALRKMSRESTNEYLFPSERGGAMTTRAFHKICQRAGVAAGFAFDVHPHMLRHACGYELVNADQPMRVMQNYLGHANANNLRRYTQLNGKQFRKVNEVL